jgi:hypothetical protein
MRKFLIALSIISAAILVGCAKPADIASRNMSEAADNFEVVRRVIFYNGITGEYMLKIEGFCSLGNNDKPKQLSLTCKTGNGEYKKHFLGLSDNVTYFVEQIDSKNVGNDHYVVDFKPSAILPQIRVN